MAMSGDGTQSYDHDFDGNGQELGGCTAEYRNKDTPTEVRITFLPEGMKLEYKTADYNTFNTCFLVNATVLPHSYIGFSGMTGGVTAAHDIVSVNVWSIDVFSWLI
jgi:mannose-binding lectin 2